MLSATASVLGNFEAVEFLLAGWVPDLSEAYKASQHSLAEGIVGFGRCIVSPS